MAKTAEPAKEQKQKNKVKSQFRSGIGRRRKKNKLIVRSM